MDPAVTLALITATAASLASLAGIATMLIGFWNQQRLFKNQQVIAAQQRAWDIEDRQGRHDKTLAAVKVVEAKAESAYTEANHVNEKIEKIDKRIVAVLEVAQAVKHSTGQHAPLQKSDIAAVAEKVVQAIRATGPLTSSGD